MSNIDRRPGDSDEPDSPRPEEGPETAREEEIIRLLRLAGPRPSVDPARAERVRAEVHARWRAETGLRRHLRLIRWIAVPAAAAAVGVVVFSFARWLPRSIPAAAPGPVAVLERVQGPVRFGDGGISTPGAELRPGTGIATGPGGRAALKLTAGASLRLDSDTILRLVSGTVLDLDRGAVYIDSDGAKGASVSVRTPGGLVRDVGTRFEVRLKENSLHVTVREGLASLGLKSGDVEVPAGTRLTTGPGGEISRTAVPPNGPEWDWILGIAPAPRLEGMTLGAFLAWVCRETGWEVRFADDARGRERASIILHGSLEGIRPDEAPAAILPTCGLTFHVEKNVLVIESLDASQISP